MYIPWFMHLKCCFQATQESFWQKLRCQCRKIDHLNIKWVSVSEYCFCCRFRGLSWCCDSAVSDMAETPDASTGLDEVVGGKNNFDTCRKHSRDTQSGHSQGSPCWPPHTHHVLSTLLRVFVGFLSDFLTNYSTCSEVIGVHLNGLTLLLSQSLLESSGHLSGLRTLYESASIRTQILPPVFWEQIVPRARQSFTLLYS